MLHVKQQFVRAEVTDERGSYWRYSFAKIVTCVLTLMFDSAAL